MKIVILTTDTKKHGRKISVFKGVWEAARAAWEMADAEMESIGEKARLMVLEEDAREAWEEAFPNSLDQYFIDEIEFDQAPITPGMEVLNNAAQWEG